MQTDHYSRQQQVEVNMGIGTTWRYKCYLKTVISSIMIMAIMVLLLFKLWLSDMSQIEMLPHVSTQVDDRCL